MLEADIARRAFIIHDNNVPENITAYERGMSGYFPISPSRKKDEIEAYKVGLDLRFSRMNVGEFVTADEVIRDISFQNGFFQRFYVSPHNPSENIALQTTDSIKYHAIHLKSMERHEDNIESGYEESREYYDSYLAGSLLALRVWQRFSERIAREYRRTAEYYELLGEVAQQERTIAEFYQTHIEDMTIEIEELEEKRKRIGILSSEEMKRLTFVKWAQNREK